MGLLPLHKNPKYKQGYFKPKQETKYVGSLPIVYRSGLELKFMRFCDSNPNVLKWSSESVIIDYVGLDGKNHKYYVDNYIIIKEGDLVKKYLVEIKPYKQTTAPVVRKQKKSTLLYESIEWDKNSRKWAAA